MAATLTGAHPRVEGNGFVARRERTHECSTTRISAQSTVRADGRELRVGL
jgi:hypothetical protein